VVWLRAMMNPAALSPVLRSMSLFEEFTEQEMAAFLDLVDPVTSPAGTIIVRQDDPGDSMYLLISGSVRVIHRRDGKQFELATLGAGDFFGEIALVDDGPRSADVEAMADCELLRLDQAVIRALAGVYPSASFKLLIAVGRLLVARLRAGNKKYIDSLLLSAGGKD
jgi:CRP-like cAMP-binding protein